MKSRRSIILMALMLALALVLTACGGEPKEKPTATVMDIRLKETPKAQYTVGETLDVSGGVLSLIYTDDTTKDIGLDAEGVTLSVPDLGTAGVKTVNIDYDGFKASFQITVAEPVFTVIFSSNDPDAAAPFAERSVQNNQTVSAPEGEPARSGYLFTGWFTAADGGDAFDYSRKITADTTVYAHWKRTYTVSFDLNYEGAPAVSAVTVAEGDAISQSQIPDANREDDFVFTGWYAAAEAEEAYDFSAPVTADLTLFAQWKQVEAGAQIVSVTFDWNREDGPEPSVVQAEAGAAVARPADPAIEGLSFQGWHTDATLDAPFDFDQPLSADVTLYAHWKVSFYIVEYKYVLDGEEVFHTKKQATPRTYLARDAVEMPQKAGYVFAKGNWYTDPECTALFDFAKTKITSNLTLYAKPLKHYTFEAEYTYIDPEKSGLGSSNAVSGVGLLGADDGSANASEGFWISSLFYNGAYVEFVITSDREITDGILTMRLSADWEDMYLAPENTTVDGRSYYKFVVSSGKVILDGQGQPVTAALGAMTYDHEQTYAYQPIALTGAISFSDSITQKRPFDDYAVTTALHLYEGMNVIRLTVANSHSHDGSMAAEAPMIDCLYVDTDAVLTWTAHTENIDEWIMQYGY